jgi:hypothetical protein
MIRMTFVAALFLLLGSSQPEKSTKGQIQLWTSGAMHGNEVIGKTGEKWFALYRTNTGFELTATKVTVIDSPGIGGLYDKFVQVNRPFETVFLVRGIADLREGSVKTVFSGHQFVKPNQFISLQLSNDLRHSYQLYAEGKEDKETIDNYKIILYSDQRRQTILSRSPTYLEGTPCLLWAGDLDRDGRLDLLMDLTNHYNVSEPTLFLSSMAAPNELVKKVASHRTVGC